MTNRIKGKDDRGANEGDDVMIETLNLLAHKASSRGHMFLHYLLQMAICEAESLAFENDAPQAVELRLISGKKS